MNENELINVISRSGFDIFFEIARFNDAILEYKQIKLFSTSICGYCGN